MREFEKNQFTSDMGKENKMETRNLKRAAMNIYITTWIHMHQASQVSIGRFPLPQKQPRPFLPWELTAQGVSYMCRNSQVVKDTAKPQFGISRFGIVEIRKFTSTLCKMSVCPQIQLRLPRTARI